MKKTSNDFLQKDFVKIDGLLQNSQTKLCDISHTTSYVKIKQDVIT